MKRHEILNSDISRVLSYMGHTDCICIGDCGLPIPDETERIDLAVKFGVPTFMDVLKEVGNDMKIEKIVLAEEIKEKKMEFSEQAKSEITTMMSAVNEILSLALGAFVENDLEKAYKVEPLEQVVDNLQSFIKKQHVTRLRKKECTIEMGFVLSDLLTNLERVSDHCSNIAVCIIEIAHESFDMHSYLQNLKDLHNKEYENNLKAYSEKYAVN